MLQKLHRGWLETFNLPFQILEDLRSKGGDSQKLELLRTFVENNIHEEVHTHLEQRAVDFLGALLKKDTVFYKSDGEEKREFLLFLCIQYGRTNKIRTNVFENAAKAARDKLGINLEKVWNPLVHIFATNIAFWLSWDTFKLILLENQSGVPFITGDQPVLNTHATNIAPGEMVEKLELYYPLSPRLALLLTKEREEVEGEILVVGPSVVQEYNWHVFKSARNEVYADAKDVLDGY